MVGASLLEFNHSIRVLINLLISLLHYCNFDMGNKICCDETHQKPSEIEKLDEEVVRNISVVEGKKNEELPPSSPQKKFEEHSHVHQDHSYPPQQEEILLPQLSPRVSEVIQTNHFFEQELAKTVAQRRRYGEDVYQGQLDEEGVKPNGLGRMYKEDGSLYVGYFSHGRAHGRGVFIFSNGSFYDGQFNHNKAETSSDSEGRYHSENVEYRGGFQNNTFHGNGVQTGDDYRFEGLYNNGTRQQGTFSWKASDGNYEYKGPFNSINKFEGKGILSEPLGIYEGDFVNGEKHGEGYYRSKNGTKYRGQYKHNERNGYGIVYNSDDSMAYEGEIKNGLPHGKGKVRSGDGLVEATWNEGIDVTLLQ